MAGLELGLLTMKKGEFSRFLFKPQYAYGNMGCPPRIPADAVVLYEVEVLDFLDSGQVDDFTALSPVGVLLVYNKGCNNIRVSQVTGNFTVTNLWYDIYLYIYFMIFIVIS